MSRLSLTIVHPASLSCQELSPLSSLRTERVSRSRSGDLVLLPSRDKSSSLELKLEVKFLLLLLLLDLRLGENSPLDGAGWSWSLTGGSGVASAGSRLAERGSERSRTGSRLHGCRG